MIPVLHPAANRAADPDSGPFLHAEALLRAGDYARGFPLLARSHTTLWWLDDIMTEWAGPHVDLQGKRLLVIGEGGYGDHIYFLRWMHILRRWGADIHFVTHPSLAPLARRQGFHSLENWAGNVDIDWRGYDYFTSLISLPAKLGVTLSNYRWPGAYVHAERARYKRNRRLRIGLCWRAGEVTADIKNRSLYENQAEVFLSLPYHWVNLTHGTLSLRMENPLLSDWLVTAEWIATLDLVVSVDTGVAHLAGAMHVPSLVLLPPEPAWQYPDNLAMHPLYPSMRLVRARDFRLQTAVDFAMDILETL